MPVARVLISGYPKFNFTPRSGSVTWKWRINWSDVSAFLYEIFPASTNTSIYQSEAEPLSKKLFASSVEIDPLGGEAAPFSVGINGDYTSNTLYMNGAVATVTYSTPESNLSDSGNNPNSNGNDPVPFLSHSWSCGGEFVNFDDKANLTWGKFNDVLHGTLVSIPIMDNDSARGTDAGFPIPTIEHQIRWSKVKNPPFHTIRECCGCVNSDAIWLRTTGTRRPILPECMMFIGAELSQDVFADGSKGWEMTYRFSERIIKAEQLAFFSDYFGFGSNPGSKLSYMPSALIYGSVPSTYYGETLPPPTGLIMYGGWNHFFDTKAGGFRPLLKPDGECMFPKRRLFPDLVTQA